MIFILIAAAVCGVDLLLKSYAEVNLDPNESKPVWKGRILLTRYHNRGAAMNFMQEKAHWLLALSSAIFGGVAVLLGLALGKKGHVFYKLGLSMIAGGAASNLADRIRKGYVVDYFSFSFLKKIIFNLGDIFIFLGSGLLVLVQLFTGEKKS